MATIPSFEQVILEVHQSLDCGSYPSKIKNKFANGGLELENWNKKASEILDAIFRTMDMDSRACADALGNMLELANFQKSIECCTWTFNASAKQILWYLLGYIYAPGLGRTVAFWNLDESFDKGMPGGNFWFMPHIDKNNGSLQLPIPSVVQWLLDLIGLSMDDLKEKLGKEKGTEKESIERNIYNWMDGNLPRSETIKRYFPDNADIPFDGVFELSDNLLPELKFQKALAFVERKKLDANKLRSQIPMTQPERIEQVLAGTASEEEKQLFIELLLVRYAKPSMKLVRQRLYVARMVQDGYRRLLEILCPNVAPNCTNPAENKLLQLGAIFSVVYNATIEAYKNSGNRVDEDVLFEESLPAWDKEGIFISILPSKRISACFELGKKFTRRFMQMNPDDELEDLLTVISGNPNELNFNKLKIELEKAAQLRELKVRRLKDEHEFDKHCAILSSDLHTHSPWRTLQKEGNFWAVTQIAQQLKFHYKIRKQAVARMRELANSDSPRQICCAISCELALLLNCSSQERPADVATKVAHLLEEARKNPAYVEWKAVFLQYEAKHCLALNKFEEAESFFNKALDACSERNFGQTPGEIARDAFAVAVANQRLIPENHEKFYRHMLLWSMFEGKELSFEDTAIKVSEYFLSDLYKPYPGVEKLKPKAALQTEKFIKTILPYISNGDMNGVREYLLKQTKKFKKSQLRDVRGDTILLALIKLFINLDKMPLIARKYYPSETNKINNYITNFHRFICLLIEMWPEQINIQDFKGQTALMLTADIGDEILVNALLSSGADVDVQDYKGSTPLHAAILSRSEKCVTSLLNHKPDVTKTTKDGRTVLHTAVSMAEPNIVQRIMEYAPSLANHTNSFLQTPLELAQAILDDYPVFQAGMELENRYVASPEEIINIITILQNQAPRA